MTYDGIGDCEVCGSEGSMFFRGNTKLFEESETCVECGFGFSQWVEKDDSGNDLVRFSTGVNDLETCNKISSDWFYTSTGPNDSDRVFRDPITKRKKLDEYNLMRKVKKLFEGVDYLNDKYFTKQQWEKYVM